MVNGHLYDKSGVIEIAIRSHWQELGAVGIALLNILIEMTGKIYCNAFRWASDGKEANVNAKSVKTINVILDETVHLKPQVIKTVLEENAVATPGVFMISPNEKVLAENNCDVLELMVMLRLLFH